jgi:recombination protein RecA
MNIVEKSGAWYSYSGTRLGQGKEQAREFLIQSKDIASEIEEGIRRQHAIDSGLGVEEEPVEADPPESPEAANEAKDAQAADKPKAGRKSKPAKDAKDE